MCMHMGMHTYAYLYPKCAWTPILIVEAAQTVRQSWYFMYVYASVHMHTYIYIYSTSVWSCIFVAEVAQIAKNVGYASVYVYIHAFVCIMSIMFRIKHVF
jgi:hypothetical protein